MDIKFTYEQLIDSFTKRYIEDVGSKTCDELFAIFDLIMKEYKETNKCPVCEKGKGDYKYNNTYVICDSGIFAINNGLISFTMKANYCPICGKRISNSV